MASALVWSRANCIRLAIVERDEDRYREEVIRDEDGRLVGVSRSYSYLDMTRIEATITTELRLARDWASKTASSAELDQPSDSRINLIGHIYLPKIHEDQRRFLTWLVATWTDPERVVTGVREIAPGIFAAGDTELPTTSVFVPPLWIGEGDLEDHRQLKVGPDTLFDSEASQELPAPAAIRRVRDIPIAGGRRRKRLLPRRTFYGVAKRASDFMFSLAALLVLSPLFLLLAIAILIDDGFPVFFGHIRQARGGKEFRCWKFRTMRRDAESMVLQLAEMNKADGPQVFIENDPRVTRVGRFLRASQLDEIPQFWNVLLGQMSFVGPRPSPDRENQYCPAWRELRLSVRPGITGLWQISRTRSPGQDFQEWIKYDIEYVRSASLSLDLKILLKTIKQIIIR